MTVWKRIVSRRNLLRLLGIGLFVYIVSLIDVSRVIGVFTRADVSLLLAGFLLSPLLVGVRAIRWTILLNRLGISIPVRTSYLYYFLGQVGGVTPGKIGEFVKAIYLKAEDFPLANSVVSIVADRLYDLAIICGVASVAFVLFFVDVRRYEIIVLVAGGLLVVLVAFLVFFRRETVYAVLDRLSYRFVPDPISSKISRFMGVSGQYLTRVTFFHFGVVTGLSALSFLVQVLRVQLFCMGLGIDLPFLALAGILSMTVVAVLLPVSVAGLGTREAVIVYFLGLYGIGFEQAISLSFLLLFGFLLSSLVGGILMTIYPPDFGVLNTD